MSGTPLDQAKALPPLDLTEENVEVALEEAKEMLGEASVKPPNGVVGAVLLGESSYINMLRVRHDLWQFGREPQHRHHWRCEGLLA